MIKKLVDFVGNPEYAKQRKWIGIGMLVAAVIADFLVDFLIPRKPGLYIWEDIPGFHALYGFVACVLIILVSKFFGHRGIMKKEDYYD
jgi:hypothetical protein